MKKLLLFLFLSVNLAGFSQTSAKAAPDMYHYSGIVVNIRDGDTFDAMVYLGFEVFKKVAIRLASIDAPEMKGKDSVAALKAKNYLSRMINGKEIFFNDSRKYDMYHRSIEDVFLSQADTVSLSTILVKKGYAKSEKY